MTGRCHRPRAGRAVPRTRATQRDRPGVLDDLPGHRCNPGREFGFEVLVGDTPVNNWHYLFTPVDGGTEVTESFRLNDSAFTKVFALLGGQPRKRRNIRDMRKTLERIKAVVEAAPE